VLSNGTTQPGGNPNPFDQILIDPVLASRGTVPQKPSPPAAPAYATTNETLQRWVGSYLNGDARADMSLDGGVLVFRRRGDAAANKLTFVSPAEAWLSEGPLSPQRVRFHGEAAWEAQRFETSDGTIWDFNDGPGVPGGVLGAEYDRHLGRYEIDIFGQPAAKATLSKKNGRLYFEDVRLTPYKNGLLFSGSGEALDLRGAIPTARNIPLKRL
jgi:hypothetical protein